MKRKFLPTSPTKIKRTEGNCNSDFDRRVKKLPTLSGELHSTFYLVFISDKVLSKKYFCVLTLLSTDFEVFAQIINSLFIVFFLTLAIVVGKLVCALVSRGPSTNRKVPELLSF